MEGRTPVHLLPGRMAFSLPLPEAEESRVLTASLANERFTASLDGLLLFDAVPVNSIPGHHRIGIATWGDDPAIERIDLSRPR